MEKFEVTDEMKDACKVLADCTDHPLSMYRDAVTGNIIVVVRREHDPEDHLAGCLEEWVNKHDGPEKTEDN